MTETLSFEKLQQREAKARAFLARRRDGSELATLNGKDAVKFGYVRGPINSESSDFYGDLMFLIKKAGGKEGENYTVTFNEVEKPGETRSVVTMTLELIDNITGLGQERKHTERSIRSGGFFGVGM